METLAVALLLAVFVVGCATPDVCPDRPPFVGDQLGPPLPAGHGPSAPLCPNGHVCDYRFAGGASVHCVCNEKGKLECTSDGDDAGSDAADAADG
jgi:hypothetical protein